MHLCIAGWLEGGKVGYPTTVASPRCGDGHVGVVLYKEPVSPSSKYDAYCYRETGTATYYLQTGAHTERQVLTLTGTDTDKTGTATDRQVLLQRDRYCYLQTGSDTDRQVLIQADAQTDRETHYIL